MATRTKLEKPWLYAKPPPCNGDDDHDDAEMTMLYEEMAVIDQVNASDLKAWKTT